MPPSFKQPHVRLGFIDATLHEQSGIVFAFGPTGWYASRSNSLIATFNDAVLDATERTCGTKSGVCGKSDSSAEGTTTYNAMKAKRKIWWT